MRRREFIAGLGSAAALPVVVRAQQQLAMPVIGFVYVGSADASAGGTIAIVSALARPVIR
jgi:hypothetical protein